jgi:hypothetical protein
VIERRAGLDPRGVVGQVISTFGDVYGHDARMAAALFGNRVGFDRPAGNSQAIAESTSRIDN